MNWMHKLPLKQRIVAGCYLVAALFAIPVLVTFMILGNIILGIVLIVVLAALTFPVARFIERTLTSSFDDIANVSHSISKGILLVEPTRTGLWGT